MSVITGRDLAPRRQSRRWLGRLVAAIFVLAVVGGAAYAGYEFFLRGDDTAALAPCPPPIATSGPPAPAEIALTVRNSTKVNGLAARTAAELTQRGFKVLSTDNAAAPLATTEVHFAPGSEPAARVVARQFSSAQVLPDPAVTGSVQVVLGVDFSALRSPEQVAAATGQTTAPAPAPRASASPCRMVA